MNSPEEQGISIRPFQWKDRPALWDLRACQLAEKGIKITAIPAQPDLSSPYEQDYHRLDRVYLSGAGNFWLAWWGETPVGHVGAQDLGGAVELRRMYVRVDYRLRQQVDVVLLHQVIDNDPSMLHPPVPLVLMSISCQRDEPAYSTLAGSVSTRNE